MTGPVAYLNGAFIPAAELSVSYADAGFASGATVTDFCRTYAGKLFRWDLHLARFRRDCAWLGVDFLQIDPELTRAAQELIRRNAPLWPAAELALVSFATPGVFGYLLGTRENGPPTLGMHTLPIDPARYAWAETGATVRAVGDWPRGEFWPANVKHRSRVGWYQAGRHPSLGPGELPALLGPGGVADTAIGSVVYFVEGTAIAPEPGLTLDGISLVVLAEACTRAGIAWREGAIDFRAAATGAAGVDEIWLAGSGFGLAPVVRACHAKRATDYPAGPGFPRVRAAWAELVEAESRGG